MKICIPTTEYPPMPGGVSSLAFEEATGLAELGEKVRVEAAPHARNLEGVAVAAETSSENGNYPAVARHHVRSGAITRLLPLTRILARSVRRNRADFVCCPTYRGFGLPVMTVAGASRVPYSIYLHGSEVQTELVSKLRKVIMSAVLSRAAFVATNSENTRRLVMRGFPLLKTRVIAIHPGVHAERFLSDRVSAAGREVRARLLAQFDARGSDAVQNSADTEPVIFVSLCRISRQKGIDLVLRALADLRARRSDRRFYYVAAGSGPDLEQFRALASKLKVDDIVDFPGGIPYGESAAILNAADVYVQPSRPLGPFLESFGISYLEAQAAGLPCIGPNWGGVPEAVVDGKTALLVPPEDVSALTAAMDTLLGNDVRNTMRPAAVEFARTMSWQRHVESLFAEIQRAVS